MYITKRILEAQVYALKTLEHKTYGEGIPYSVHLFLVVNIAYQFVQMFFDDKELIEDIIIATWLHDVREDAGISYNEIKQLFGERVAEMVYCVTNEDGRDRKEKAIKTYPKTAQNRHAVFVKLADRIGNTLYSQMNGSRMYKRYCEEYPYFREILHKEGEYGAMWNYLEVLANEKTTA